MLKVKVPIIFSERRVFRQVGMDVIAEDPETGYTCDCRIGHPIHLDRTLCLYLDRHRTKYRGNLTFGPLFSKVSFCTIRIGKCIVPGFQNRIEYE
jgi:hypothetical protein